MPHAQGISVPRKLGERAIRILRSLSLLDAGFQIRSNDELTIPLTRKPDDRELAILGETLGTIRAIERDFQSKEHMPRSLREALTGVFPDPKLSLLPNSMDIVGKVAILEIPSGLEQERLLIGKAILDTHKNLKTVLAKTGPIAGQLRLGEYEVIAGDTNTETTHKEYGCVYLLNPLKVYFSPRLSTERRRVAGKVGQGEVVLDMFAGVGPFSILIAKTQPKTQTYAIELNPIAAQYLEKNIALNHVIGLVTPIVGDTRNIVQSGLLPKINRVIMNLPETALYFIESACQCIGDSGIIHYYAFKKGSKALEEAEEEVISEVASQGRKVVAVEDARLVKETAPRTWQVAVDLRIH